MFRSGQQIGPYIMLRRLGRGGFGEVWLAERPTGFAVTQVAIKLPHDEQVDQKAIEQEATLWAKASGHINVLPILEANEYKGQIVIVSEYAADGSLEAYLKTHGAFSVAKAVEITMGIMNGLQFLHSRLIIHRDLKPGNILLQGETPRLADFGISRLIRTNSMSANVAGTPKYMAPEAFDGKRNAQTDIWSTGVILYELLTGTLPFPQEHPGELLAAIIMREPKALPASIAQELKDIVMKALEKDITRRYQTAEEMIKDLARCWHSQWNAQRSRAGLLQSLLPTETTVDSPTVQLYPYCKANQFGYCDINRNVVIRPEYYFVYPFSEGLATVAHENPYQASISGHYFTCRVIDETGNVVIPIKYDRIHSFTHGVSVVENIGRYNRTYGLIDRAGKLLSQFRYGAFYPFSEGFAAVRYSRKFGFVDLTGSESIPRIYDDARSFSEGLAAVCLDTKWGFVDRAGQEIIPLKYDAAGQGFNEGLAAVSLNGKWGFVDGRGRTVIAFDYDAAGPFAEGLAVVKLDDRLACIDKTGNIVTPWLEAGETSVSSSKFSEGLVGIAANGKYGFIDRSGNVVVPLKYDLVSCFHDGLSVVSLNGKYGFIDKGGREVIRLKYDFAMVFRQGVAQVRINDREFYIGNDGTEYCEP